MPIDRDKVRRAQRNLASKGLYNSVIDGILGPVSYAGMFNHAANRKLGNVGIALGEIAAKEWPDYDINDNEKRMAHFIGNTCHETVAYRHFSEIGSKQYFMRYDPLGPKPDLAAKLGNSEPGDGYLFRGRGIPQLTGRYNYAKYGAAVGVDLIRFPHVAADISVSFAIACEFWQDKHMNAYADAGNGKAIVVAWNGGTNGLDERLAYANRVMDLWK